MKGKLKDIIEFYIGSFYVDQIMDNCSEHTKKVMNKKFKIEESQDQQEIKSEE